VKIRELLKRIRLRPLEGNGERPIDDVDALATMAGETLTSTGSPGPAPAPTNWVPSQQDERPRN
jgi:hypothetical protein